MSSLTAGLPGQDLLLPGVRPRLLRALPAPPDQLGNVQGELRGEEAKEEQVR